MGRKLQSLKSGNWNPHTFRFKCVYETRHTRDLTVDQIMQNGGEPVMCDCGGPMFMTEARAKVKS